MPLNPKLFVPLRDKHGNLVPLMDEKGKPVPLSDHSGNAVEMIPLIRVAYRSPWDGKVVNSKNAQSWDKQSYYMVVDVTNLARDPSLRSIEDPVQRRAAIRAIADAVVVAADWNGDVYWRHLTTFLEAYKAGNSAAQTLYGGAIAGSFISPVLGASLAGSALVIDTAVRDYTANLDVDVLREIATRPLRNWTWRAFSSDVRCPDPTAAAEMIRTIEQARTDGDSVGGAIARQFLATAGVRVQAWVSQVGDLRLGDHPFDPADAWSSPVRCPHLPTAKAMAALIEEVRAEGDSIGGCVSARLSGIPPGLGEPVFDKLHADLGKALLSINAVKGFEIGAGFASAGMRGSAHNALPSGVQGGISTGAAIVCRLAFKPASTIAKPQQAVDKEGMEGPDGGQRRGTAEETEHRGHLGR